MDRLYVVTIAALFLFACDENAKAQKPVSKSRVNAVVAKKNVGDAPKDFCDTYYEPTDARTFAWPIVDETPAAKTAQGAIGSGKWAWINVWATWCKPCIEEMPRLTAWTSEISQLGNVVFVSADDTPETVSNFREKHPEIPDGPRISEGLKEWTVEMGFDANAPLPLHLFVDGTGKIRCVRAGGVSEHNKTAVERLVTQ